MKRETYSLLENYMLSCTEDSAHDREHVYDHFYTKKAASLARERRQAAVDYYNCLYREAASAYRGGKEALNRLLK